MTILGISCFYHDSAAAIIEDGKIIAAAQEERFTRKKHDDSFPANAVKFCLQYAACEIDDIDAIAFYDKPLLKFERLLETYYGFAPKGLVSFLQAMPVWMREKMFLKRILHEELEKIGKYNKRKVKFLFPEHHLSHAASAFYPSAFQDAAILTIDGVGEWATASIGKGEGGSIEIMKELRFPHSVGLLYSAFTYYLGFIVNSGEYKLMGLAPYGNANAEQTKQFIHSIKTVLVDIKPDGSVWLNQEYFNYATGLRMARDDKWEKLFGFKRKEETAEPEQHHCNLAFAIQQVTEEIVEKMAREAKRLTNSNYLCMAGGVALNCVANGKLLASGLFEDIFIQPAAGDAGGALGAALAAYFIYFKGPRKPTAARDEMQGAYLGPEFSDREIVSALKKNKAVYQKPETFEDLAKKVAACVADGQVAGWFQGRMEFGPRALGNRSILGDARNPEMQKKLNLKIKYREGFRPFAPAVKAENCSDYFNLNKPSPYMLLVAPVKEQRRKKLPENYELLPMYERLYTLRSDIPAVTHIDFSARVQTVHRDTNERLWQLIDFFEQQTRCSVLVNTSFNVRGEPPVCTPGEAYQCFMRTEMDLLVIGDYLLFKAEQPEWKGPDDWKEKLNSD